MKITQGAFSFLPDLTDEEILKQVEYCIGHHWALGVEFTDDPHPRNPLWEMWDLPMFDANDASAVVFEMNKIADRYSAPSATGWSRPASGSDPTPCNAR